MKKRLHQFLLAVGLTGTIISASAQTEEGTRLPLPSHVNVNHLTSGSRSFVQCGPDTIRYPYLKELGFNAPNDSFFIDAMVGNMRTASQAYHLNDTVTVLGVQFWGGAYTVSNAPQALPTRVYLYSVDAFNMPVAVIDSADLIIGATYDFYEANFTTPRVVSQNFAVGVRSIINDTIAVITNNAGGSWQSPYYGESLAWRRFGSGTWNSTLAFFGQDLEYMIFPIVRYRTHAAFTASDSSVCAGTNVTFTNTSTPIYSNRMFNLLAFDDFWGFAAADSTHSWNFGTGSGWTSATNTSNTFNTAGTFPVKLRSNMIGYFSSCTDSMTVNITVAPGYNETVSASICAGDTLMFGTQTLTTAGTYVEMFQSIAGCDSSVSLTLALNPAFDESTSAAICSGDTYTFGAQNLTTAGTYVEVFQSGTGCDSTVTLTLAVNPTYSQNLSASICEGETYVLGTQTLTAPGTYNETFQSAFGCDSAVTLNLSVTSVDATVTAAGSTLTANAAGGTYQWVDCDNSNSPISGATSQAFTASIHGNYAVIVTFNNCSDTSACIPVQVSGIENNGNAPVITVYPNPTSGVVFINSNGTVADQIFVTNALGQVVKTIQPNGTLVEISLEGMSNAVYFVNVIYQQSAQTFKVLKQ